MDRILVTVDAESDPEFVIVTTLVAKAGIPEAAPRREILSQASEQNGLSHQADQITPEKRDEISAKELRKIDAATTNWGGLPAFIAVEEDGKVVDAIEKRSKEGKVVGPGVPPMANAAAEVAVEVEAEK